MDTQYEQFHAAFLKRNKLFYLYIAILILLITSALIL